MFEQNAIHNNAKLELKIGVKNFTPLSGGLNSGAVFSLCKQHELTQQDDQKEEKKKKETFIKAYSITEEIISIRNTHIDNKKKKKWEVVMD